MTQNNPDGSNTDTQEVEVYSRQINAWIVRTPGRQFPALVVQGDSFHQLFVYAQSVYERTRNSADRELRDDAERLRDILWNRLRHYEDTLHAAGFTLPYTRTAWKPKE